MINPIDLNSIDVVSNISPTLIPDNYSDYEQIESTEHTIKDQYIKFENLGVDLLVNSPNDNFKFEILSNMIDYVNENYISIIDFDADMLLPEKLTETGTFIYQFLCIDCYNIIIPRLLATNNCYSIDSFDLLIRNRFKNDYSIVKANLVKTIKGVIDELSKLQLIDRTIQNDTQYKSLLMKFAYYVELVDFGNTEKFINNYFRPLLTKNFDSILWRI